MTRTSTRRKSEAAAGFTMIEVLVTLVIIGILAGLATLAVGGRAHRQARDEAERLFQLLNFASEEATLQGEEFGLLIERDSYRFLRFDGADEVWLPLQERHYAEHTIPGGVSIEVELGESMELASSKSTNTLDAPEIVLLSSGEISSFAIEFRSTDGPDAAARISSDGSGTLAWN
jgi:general secretion pathway protein H